MGLGNWVSDFIPDDDAEPHIMKNWRRRVALVSCSAWVTLFTILIPTLVAILFVGIPMVGQVAWADDQDRKVEKKIAAAIAPINDKLGALDSKLSDQSALLYEQVTAALASNICRYTIRRNKETDLDERNRLFALIQDMRQKYKRYSGIEFDLKDC